MMKNECLQYNCKIKTAKYQNQKKKNVFRIFPVWKDNNVLNPLLEFSLNPLNLQKAKSF